MTRWEHMGDEYGRAMRNAILSWIGIISLVSTACSSGRSYLPPPPVTEDISMLEYRFEHPHPVLPAGRVVFQVRNVGNLSHDLSLVRIPEDAPPVQEITAPDGKGPKTLATFAALLPLAAGDHTTLAVDLTPGRYGLICFVQDPDGQAHSEKGMATEIRVE